LTTHGSEAMTSFEVPGNVEMATGWLGASPFSWWIQVRGGGVARPLCLNATGGAVGIGTTNPGQEATNCRLAVVGASGQRASNLATSNTQALISFRPDVGSGYTLAVGLESAGNGPYLQGVNWNGGAAASHLMVQPWGGNVGIGTTTPGATLDVNGSIRIANGQNLIFNSASNSGIQFFGAATYIYRQSSDGSLQVQAGQGCLQLNPGGNSVTVGLAPAIGGALLSVISATNATTPATSNQIIVGENTNNTDYRLMLGYYNTGFWCGSVNAKQGGIGGPLMINGMGGFVGIGNLAAGLAPASQLHIFGAGSANYWYANGDAGGAQLLLQDSGGGANNGGSILFGWGGQSGGASAFAMIKGVVQNGTGPAGDLILCTRATSGNIVEHLRVNSAGQVNITGSLTVNGAAVGGGVSTQSGNLSGSRAFGGKYQNTSGKAMFVAVQILAGGGAITANAYTDASSNPGTMVAQISQNAGWFFTMYFWVLPNNWYTVGTSGGTIQTWFEWN